MLRKEYTQLRLRDNAYYFSLNLRFFSNIAIAIPYTVDLGYKFEATKLSRRTVYTRYLLYYKYNRNERPCGLSSVVSRNWPPPAARVYRI